jgi:hypothetical protein
LWRLSCCVFLHLLVVQINERRYNASIGERHRSDLRDRATGTGGQVDPMGARWRFSCCVFLHLLVLQINERRYNASNGELMREDTTLVMAKGTHGQAVGGRIRVSMAPPTGGSSSAVRPSSGDSDWGKCRQRERFDKQGEWQLEDVHGNSARCREASLETGLLKKSSTMDTGGLA